MHTIEASVSEVWRANAVLGEGPHWNPANKKLYWLDIKGQRLHVFHHATAQKQSWELPFRLGSIATAPDSWSPPEDLEGDVLLACGDQGFGWLGVDPNVSFRTIVHPEADRKGYRFNDGKILSDNRYWAGTMDNAEVQAEGRLYAFSKNGRFDLMDDNYRVPNGPALSPDGKTLYHTDSAKQTVYSFDLDTDGTLTNKRIFLTITDGYPDGMTVAPDNTLWIAIWDGARIDRFGADGTLLGSIPMPTPRCTSCVFANSRVLYATSAAIGLDADPMAGSLFRIDLAKPIEE